MQSDDFIVVYHNCGNAVEKMLPQITATGCAAYHFGNAVDMVRVLECVPENVVCLGNVDPAREFRNGTPESIRAATTELLKRTAKYKNFILSSGCDIPPLSKWENIDAFFDAAAEFID